MKSKLYVLLIFMIVSMPAMAQYKTVMFNYERAYFDDGQPLPAETKFIVTGETSPTIGLVELKLYESSNTKKEPFYQNSWKRRVGSRQNTFSIPVSQPLRGNEEYTFVLNFYSPITVRQQRRLLGQVNEALSAYINQSYQVERNSIEMRENPSTVRSDMNAIVNQGLSLYRNQINYKFDGFSDIVLDKLKQIQDLNLKKARFNIFSKEDADKTEIRLKYAQEQLEALKSLVQGEVAQYVGPQLYALTDTKIIKDYATEKTKNVIALNFGYGGVYYSGSASNFTSDTAPYAGISLPLGKAPFSSAFWNNTSISAGVFLKNLDFGDGKVATGPLVQRPVFVGLGYKVLPFIRLNAGATVLQDKKGGNSLSDLSLDRIYVRPFVGLSLEVNLWLNLSR
ncbi:hypothetical protein [Pontibacter chitinilyticus]|uniref:hypothetical protein n=1 Tax=Pontibacter chitinilyticus TaxID=2674989 RepID=UPI00321C3B2B